MSGTFQLTSSDELPKHAHLRFSTIDEKNPETLSFVDTRRFGTWKETSGWTDGRGPDPMFEYEAFRKNVLENLEKPLFKKPICEVLLDQTYFNGIGNYLRAEILYKANIPPFNCAREVLEPLVEKDDRKNDILFYCHSVPLELVKLGEANPHAGTVPDILHEEYVSFIKCYMNPDMKCAVDANKRSIFFQGEPGPLIKPGALKPNWSKRYKKDEKESDKDVEPTEKPRKKKRN